MIGGQWPARVSGSDTVTHRSALATTNNYGAAAATCSGCTAPHYYQHCGVCHLHVAASGRSRASVVAHWAAACAAAWHGLPLPPPPTQRLAHNGCSRVLVASPSSVAVSPSPGAACACTCVGPVDRLPYSDGRCADMALPPPPSHAHVKRQRVPRHTAPDSPLYPTPWWPGASPLGLWSAATQKSASTATPHPPSSLSIRTAARHDSGSPVAVHTPPRRSTRHWSHTAPAAADTELSVAP